VDTVTTTQLHRRRSGSVRAAAVPIAVLTLLIGAGSPAQAVPPSGQQDLGAPPVLVAGGPGNQDPPTLSGDLLAYADSGAGVSVIRYVDLGDGTSGTVPAAGASDSSPDVSGSSIVFRRAVVDGSTGRRPIMLFDVDRPSPTRPTSPPRPSASPRTAARGAT
jgi:hypothetical protein